MVCKTQIKLQHFLAQAGHESKKITGYEFESFEENLNYKWKDLGVIKYNNLFNPYTNPTADPKKQNPINYKRNATSIRVDSEKYANLVYDDANRKSKNKLGNINVGDGYKFRGRGIFQLTGRYNYGKFTDFYKLNYDATKDFETNPELLQSNTEIAVISALWFYKKKVLDKFIPTMTNAAKSNKVSRLINGGNKGKKRKKSIL